jgi:hypothetical protein
MVVHLHNTTFTNAAVVCPWGFEGLASAAGAVFAVLLVMNRHCLQWHSAWVCHHGYAENVTHKNA